MASLLMYVGAFKLTRETSGMSSTKALRMVAPAASQEDVPELKDGWLALQFPSTVTNPALAWDGTVVVRKPRLPHCTYKCM